MPRNMLLYAATEAEILNPALAVPGMRQIRDSGFESVYLEFRNVRAPRNGRRFARGISELVKVAKDACLYVAIEAAINNLDPDLLEDAPDAFTDAIRLHRLEVSQGRVSLQLEGDVSTWTFPYAAFATIENERIRDLKKTTLPEPEILIEGGGCAMTRHPGRSRARYTWEIPGMQEGTLLLVTRKHHEYAFKDLAHPAVLDGLPALIASRLDLDPDEIYWDEPHFGFAFYHGDGRAISNRLLEEFQRKFGYRLEDRLPELWLDWDQSPTPSCMVRLHFAELLESALAELEQALRATIQKQTEGRRPVNLGGHRTMHEELSDDILIGCADYFRHDAATTASFTDSVFEREDSMIAMAHLARSMAVGQPGRTAWNMSWGFLPTPEHQHFYARLLGAMNVRWCAHAWNDSMMFGPGLPHHPCWKSMKEDLAAHQERIDALQGWEPFADTLVLYNWRALAAVVGAHRNTHRRALLLLAQTLTKSAVPFLFASPDNLGGAISKDIRRIILPWPEILPAQVWSLLQEWTQNGGELIIMGPPATRNAEGQSVVSQWESLTGTRVLSNRVDLRVGSQTTWGERLFSLNPGAMAPGWDDAPLATLPEHWPALELEPVGSDCVATVEGKVVGTSRSLGNGRVVTTTVDAALFPDLIEHTLELRDPQGHAMAFRYTKGSESKTVEVVRH